MKLSNASSLIWEGWHPCFPGVSFNEIGDEATAKLEEVFTAEEVFIALSGLNGNKAPGPDGFSLAFWLFSWDFVNDEVIGFF